MGMPGTVVRDGRFLHLLLLRIHTSSHGQWNLRLCNLPFISSWNLIALALLSTAIEAHYWSDSRITRPHILGENQTLTFGKTSVKFSLQNQHWRDLSYCSVMAMIRKSQIFIGQGRWDSVALSQPDSCGLLRSKHCLWRISAGPRFRFGWALSEFSPQII